MDDELSLEEELLQVAGRSRPSKKKRARSPSDSDEEGQADGGSSADQPGSNKKRGSTKRPGAGEEDDDSDADTDYGDGYGSDLIGDEDDRAKLMAMNELEREMILADRSEARDREREKRSTALLLQQRHRETDQAGQMRSSTRMKSSDTAKKSAMAELVAAQARRRKSHGSKNRRRKDQDDEAWSDEDDEEDLSGSELAVSDKSSLHKSDQMEEEGQIDKSEDERGRRRSPSRYVSDDDDEIQRFPEREEADEADFSDVQRIQLSRRVLAKWLNQPFFERTLPGTMVRLAVHKSYMLAEVEAVIEQDPGPFRCLGTSINSPYKVEENLETNKWLQVVRGNSRQLMPLMYVSNKPFTEEEWEAWLKQCRKDSRSQLTRAEVKEVAKKHSQAHTYVYTPDDVKRIIEEKRAKGSVRNVALEKARLIQHREAARAKGDAEEEARLSELIDDMERQKKMREEAEDKKGTANRRYGMIHINAKNKERNFKNALHNVGARPAGIGSAASTTGVDPFSRRNTRPTVMWSTKKHSRGLSVATNPAAAGEQPEEDLEPDTPLATATAVENAAGGIDLNIDVSVLEPQPPEAILSKQLLGTRWQQALSPYAVPADLASKKLLTLTDYKRRQGIA